MKTPTSPIVHNFPNNLPQQPPSNLAIKSKPQRASRCKDNMAAWIDDFFSTHQEHARQDPLKKYVMLVFFGSFNPIHNGHLATIEAAEQAINDYIGVRDDDLQLIQYVSIGCIIALNPQQGLQAKFFDRQELVISRSQREQLCQLATQDSPHIMTFPQDVYGDINSAGDVIGLLRRNHPELAHISCYKIHGGDVYHANKNTNRWKHDAETSIVVQRPGYNSTQPSYGPSPFLMVRDILDIPNCSSTQIRNAIKRYQSQSATQEDELTLSYLPEPVRNHLLTSNATTSTPR